jgi:choice-of-anchor C domain-containing protein
VKISWLICILSCVVSAQANLITNGSFETPVVPAAGFDNFVSGSTGITGWTVVGPEVSVVSTTYASECCSFPAEDGTQWLDLTGDGSNTLEGVQQTVATTPGTTYDLSFWVGNTYDPGGVYGTTSTVDVRLGGADGTLLGAFTNSSTTTGTLVWEQFNTSFTATGSSTTLDFLNADPESDNSNGLDNVSLTVGTSAVPEPGTLPLLGIAIGGLAIIRISARTIPWGAAKGRR